MRHEATEACPAYLIRLISFLLATHSLVAGWLYGRMWDMGRRFVLLAARPLPAHAPSFSSSRRISLVLIAFFHSLIHEARKPGAEAEAKGE